jgi:hypothetical protein
MHSNAATVAYYARTARVLLHFVVQMQDRYVRVARLVVIHQRSCHRLLLVILVHVVGRRFDAVEDGTNAPIVKVISISVHVKLEGTPVPLPFRYQLQTITNQIFLRVGSLTKLLS